MPLNLQHINLNNVFINIVAVTCRDHVISFPPFSGSGWPSPVLGCSNSSSNILRYFLNKSGFDFFHFAITLSTPYETLMV